MLNEELVKRVIGLVDKGLVRGLGEQKPGKMCVEAVICAALGLEHGDDPGCVMQPLRRFKIILNDSIFWRDDLSRASGMRRLAVAQIGSLGMNEVVFVEELSRLAIKWAAESAESAESAEWAADSAKWAAKSANWAAESERSAKWAAEWAADRILASCAEDVVQLLIKLEAPGTKFLYLTEQPA